MSTHRRIVLFDLYGVIARCQRPGTLVKTAARCNVPADAFAEAYWACRRPYDAGPWTASAYRTAVPRWLSRTADADTIEGSRGGTRHVRPPVGPIVLTTGQRPAVDSVIVVTELEELVLPPGERARGVQVDRVIFTMDWSGEEVPGELAAFVAARVRAFGVEPTDVDTDVVHRAAEAGPTPRRGDFPIRQLDHLSGVLAPLGCTLMVPDSGNDTYEVLVALTGEREPTGLTHQDIPVRAWGSQPEETLISLDCPNCSETQVWQLPAAQTLADERCTCGVTLFDAVGRPLPHVTLHD
ncbi:hypothetical protein [Streptomyces sp. NBC_01237]|uniref:hypothetical protein n=1 Tax=Streptomyces sp. NBC_01237 TaxID=2903790 RepID=UPI002DDB34C2|nr:hypothetical protein [Streptomyces sp. NBC_01237]WRZ70882.1 hypothetical protein OG251_04280 [Streptomyces sp. NBC_01237]